MGKHRLYKKLLVMPAVPSGSIKHHCSMTLTPCSARQASEYDHQLWLCDHVPAPYCICVFHEMYQKVVVKLEIQASPSHCSSC